MNMKVALWVGVASVALLANACSTVDDKPEPFTKTSADGSLIQSVPTPLEAVPEKPDDGDLGEVSARRDLSLIHI